MDMKTYLKQASAEERESLARAVESSVGYLYLLGGGHRKASSKLCQKLVAAEPKLTLGELRPDIWGRADEPKSDRRATDPEPEEGRAGRQLPSAKNLMGFGLDQSCNLKV